MTTLKYLTVCAFLLLGVSMLAIPADAQRAIGGRGSSGGSSGGSKSVGGSGQSGSGGSRIGGSGSSGGSRSVGGSGSSGGGSRVGGSGSSGGSRSATPSPSRSTTPSRSATPSPAPSRSTTPSRSATPSPSASRSTAPSSRSTTPSRSSVPRVEDSTPSNARRVNDSYRSPTSRSDSSPSDVRRTSSGVPDLRKAETDNSRVARDVSASRTTSPTRTTRSIEERPTVSRYDFQNSRSRTTTTRVAGPTTLSERSTLTSFRTTGFQTRGGSGYATHSHGHSHGYRYNWYPSGWYSGWSWHGSWGSFSIGWYFPSYYSCGWGYWPGYYSHGWSWNSGVYWGSFAAAFLIGNAWHITAYPGYYGYYGWGRYCYYPWHHYRRHHRYHWHGVSVCVHRPYWYDYGIWWDYRPSYLGYTRYVYENLYDEGYDDGYDKGYDRGYEDGAENNAYRDSRERDSLHRPSREYKERDRERGNAAEEYSYEMEQGFKAFEAGDYEGATRSFKEAVILDPSSAPAKLNLALAAFASGKYSFAAFGIRRGLAQHKDAARSEVDLRSRYRDGEVLVRQLSDLDKAVKAEPDADKLLVQGYMRLFTGDAEGAAQSLERAAGYAPQDEAVKALYKAALDKLEKK